jgi:hypothetical protein
MESGEAVITGEEVMSNEEGIKKMMEALDGLDSRGNPNTGVRPLATVNDPDKLDPSLKKRLIKFDYDEKVVEKRKRAKNPITKRLDAIK